MFKRKSSKSPRIDSLIGAVTRVEGDVLFSGGLHLDGHINGNVRGMPEAASRLSVSETGAIEGSVTVDDIVLNGLVKGDIVASGRVDLGGSARVLGNVHYAVIETAVGAQINGKLVHVLARTPPTDGDAGPADESPL